MPVETLAMVPKMLAVVCTILVLLPWILRTLHDFASSLFSNLTEYGLSVSGDVSPTLIDVLRLQAGA